MPARINHHTKFIYYLAFLICVSSTSAAYPEIVQPRPWIMLETKHTIIRFLQTEDVDTFNRNMDFNRKSWGLKQLFSDNTPDSLHSEISEKTDNLYERVQEILDMRKKAPKVFINLYSNRKELDQVYYELYQSKNNIRAWYIFDHNTIYLNVEDVHEGMLAHEMAHAIIDHFLLVRPPSASAEILARYVDTHIHQ